jgi:hypothetical protein
MAARTDGSFTPVRNPGDLLRVVEDLSVAQLNEVILRSATTGNRAHPFRLAPDGSWVGFIRMVPGLNQVEVVARSDDGSEATRTLDLSLDEKAPRDTVPPDFVVLRNELLKECLADARRARASAERQVAEQMRKVLRLEIEEERRKALDLAVDQRKELELEVEFRNGEMLGNERGPSPAEQ